jgi:phosphohistidine phosphatase
LAFSKLEIARIWELNLVMKLILIRHGEAGKAETDELRRLSADGKEEIARLAKALARIQFEGAEIRHSGLLRAEESAVILAEALGLRQKLLVHPELAPMEPPMNVLEAIQGRKSDLILVGHQPFMGKMASCLLSGSEVQKFVDFATGAAACFRPPAIPGGNWRLTWLMDPALLA